MASLKDITLLFLLVQATFLINYQVHSQDEEDNLLQDINEYRSSLNLTTLTKNTNAACLAEQIVDQYKDRPCTNTTGSSTIPGTEDQFPNYPDFLSHCHLNLTNSKDSAVMPVCVPDLDPTLVRTNFTKSQYSGYLNQTKFTGAGIESSGDWIVVVLSSNSSTGSFDDDSTSFGMIFRPSLVYCLTGFIIGCFWL